MGVPAANRGAMRAWTRPWMESREPGVTVHSKICRRFVPRPRRFRHSITTVAPTERPNVSGLYISSARAGAARNVPGVLARTV